MPRILARKSKVGAACRVKAGKRRGLAGLESVFYQIGENLIPLTRGFGDQIFTTFKVAIDSSRGDPRLFGRF